MTGSTFDLLNTGTAIHSGWITSGEGFLAVDANGNGVIDNRSELFGGAVGEGFADLAKFDSNRDGVIDARDRDFDKLLIWRDLNGDHRSEAGELMSLSEAGIASLSLRDTVQPQLQNGNRILERSSVTMTDGRKLAMADVYFETDAAEASAASAGAKSMPQVVLSGMPVGTTLNDGTHSATTTAANPNVDITGWNSSTLSITTPLGYGGTLTLQATATAPGSTGSQAGISRSMTVQVDTVAQVPTLTLIPPAGSVSRTLINTSWPRVNNDSYNATILNTTRFAGWSTTPVARGKEPAFEIWANGGQGVQSPSGTGREWLGLSNGVGSNYQAPGIAQTIQTIAGAQYTLNFGYAGQLGLSSANTQIGVYLDGRLLGLYGNISTNGLNWKTLGYAFQGDGRAHALSIELINGTNTSTARGALLDALTLVETLPSSAGTAYGFAGAPIPLPRISDALAADGSGQLETTLVGLPVGAIVTDGRNTASITSSDSVANITGWSLKGLAVTVPRSRSGSFNLQVIATSVEPTDGSMASVAKNVTVHLLAGQSCATPVGCNPYVSYANNDAATQTTGPVTGGLVASALVPVSSSGSTIVVPTGGNGTGTQAASAADLGASLDKLLAGLSESVSEALRSELGM